MAFSLFSLFNVHIFFFSSSSSIDDDVQQEQQLNGVEDGDAGVDVAQGGSWKTQRRVGGSQAQLQAWNRDAQRSGN